MSLTVLKQLEYRVREQNGAQTVPMAAFVGAMGDDLASFGIGLISETGQAQFWGLLLPHCLITAYRGMQVLDKVTDLQHGTICACYYAGERNLSENNRHYLDELVEQIPDILEMRVRLLAERISDNELDAMLAICSDAENGINLSTSDLTQEIESDVISKTDGVKAIMRHEREERERYEANQSISRLPLPSEQSFATFCEDFGVMHLCDAPYGAYGWDWDHEKLSTLDEEIVFRGLQHDSVKYVYCTEFSEGEKDFGNIGHPVLRFGDNSEDVVMECVIYQNDAMYAHLCGVGIGATDRGLMKLTDLRALAPTMTGVAALLENGEGDEAEKYYISLPIEMNRRRKKKRGPVATFFSRLLG